MQSIVPLTNGKNGTTEGSCVIMTPNAFMMREAWMEFVPSLCDSICSMPIICDKPDWWCTMSLDGFSSYIMNGMMMEIFTDRMILPLKEEGDTSHINQPYDQSIMRRDKMEMQSPLDIIRAHHKDFLN